eukprot:SAG31_NODE_8276_length_1482_cov_1.023861_1_plen_45_part_10
MSCHPFLFVDASEVVISTARMPFCFRRKPSGAFIAGTARKPVTEI